MKLSSRQQLLKEASNVLSELKKDSRPGSSIVYTSDEVNRINQLMEHLLKYSETAIGELNQSKATIRKLRAELKDSSRDAGLYTEHGNSLTTTQLNQFIKNVFGYNKQWKSVYKLVKETERLVKMLGR